MRRARLWPALLPCLGLALAAPVVASPPGDATATLAAWNIKRCVDPERARAIAEVLRDIDADLVMLSEVQAWDPDVCGTPRVEGWDNPAVLAAILAALQEMGLSYLGAMPPQPHGLDLAVIWKPEAVQVGAIQLVPGSDLGTERHRQALSAPFRIGAFDGVAVGVHFKSGRGGVERQTRSRQAGVVADWTAQIVAAGEGDVLVVGDYNMIPGQDDRAFQSLSNGGLELSSYNLDGGSHIRSGEAHSLLDGWSMTPGVGEYIPGTLEIAAAHTWTERSLGRFSYEVSDHLPLVARFRVGGEDDD